MKMDVIYSKYNYQRLPRFQAATHIVLERGRKQAIKRALTPQAAEHIARVGQEHLRWAGVALPRGGFELPGMREAGAGALAYDFIEGPSLDDLLSQAFWSADRVRFWGLLEEYVRRLRTGFKTVAQCPAEGQADIERVFGRSAFPWVPEAPEAFLPRAVIDLIFDNVIIAGERWVLVDNEWVFPGCVPVAYVIYRALFEFYELKWREFGIERFIPFQAAAQRCGIDEQAATHYREMEDHFQTYVCGKERLHFNLRYLKGVETIPHLREVIARQTATIAEQHGDLERKNGLIADQRGSLARQYGVIERQNGILARQNAILNDQESALRDLRQQAGVLADIRRSYGYRMLSAACRALDRILPPGSRRRRWVLAPLRRLLAALGRTKQPS